MEDKAETTETTDSTPPPAPEKLSPSGMASIQGDVDSFQLYKEQYRAHEDHDLANDLMKFRDRPNPNPRDYPSDPLKEETETQIQQADQQAEQHGSAALEKMQQMDPELEEPIKVVRDQAQPYQSLTTLESFEGSPEVKYAKGNEIFNRWCPASDKAEGKYMTRDHFASSAEAQEKLALPETNTADKEVKLKVDPGTPFLEGRVAKQFGREGGGNQVFVPDASAIHEVTE